MREPSMIQRLLREKALGGYLTALERGDIDEIIASLERAEHDPVLERMILEVHESYQTEEDFQTMFLVEQEPRPSVVSQVDNDAFLPDFNEAEEFELEPASQLISVPLHRPGKPARWRQVLAAVLLIALLSSSIFIYTLWQRSVAIPLLPKIHYNWCVPPNAYSSTQSLPESIFAVSPNDMWLLGTKLQIGLTGQISIFFAPGLEHWNGQSWNEVATASTTALFSQLLSRVTYRGTMDENVSFNDLAIVSADDIWAVGSIEISQSSLVFASQSTALPQSTETVLAEQALIEHWDGSKWSIVSVPDISDQGVSSFSSVAAVSADNIWAVGESPVAHENRTAPLVEHWDGQRWQAVQFPAQQLNVGSLQAVKVVSGNDIWVFGLLRASTLMAAAIHWNGKSWNSVPLPDAIRQNWFVNEVVIAWNDIWVIEGGGSSNGQAYPSLLAHWDGQQWKQVASAQDVKAGGYLRGLAAGSANDVWAVGSTADNRPLIEHWDGRAWSLQSLKTPSYGFISSIAIIEGRTWIIVGAYVSAIDNMVRSGLMETSCP